MNDPRFTEFLERVRATLKLALRYLDNSDYPGGCDGKHSDCDHCDAIRAVRLAIVHAADLLKKDAASEQQKEAHKVMTKEEYITTPLAEWHEVCRNYDGFGGIGIRYLGEQQQPDEVPKAEHNEQT
jgi:hypothetical protein